MSRRRAPRRRRLGWVAPHGLNPTFTERMEIGREQAAIRRASGRAAKIYRAQKRPTAAQERKMWDEAARQYAEEWAATTPCNVGRPGSGGCTTSGRCSWHGGIKWGPAPF